MKKPRLICFDLDDTLIRDIHSVMIPCLIHGKAREHDEIQNREMAKEIDYMTADYLRASLLKGLEEALIKSDFLKYARPLKNIKEALWCLHQEGIQCILITVGPIQVAKVVAEIYGFDGYYGSEYEVCDGRFTGKISQYVKAESKIDCLKDYCSRYGIEPSDCLSVGDGATDIPLFEYCGRSIAINSSEEVKRHATHAIKTDDLMDLFIFVPRT